MVDTAAMPMKRKVERMKRVIMGLSIKETSIEVCFAGGVRSCCVFDSSIGMGAV